MCHKQSEIPPEKGLINPARSLHEAIFIWRAQKTPSQGKQVQTCIICQLTFFALQNDCLVKDTLTRTTTKQHICS